VYSALVGFPRGLEALLATKHLELLERDVKLGLTLRAVFRRTWLVAILSTAKLAKPCRARICVAERAGDVAKELGVVVMSLCAVDVLKVLVNL
jgi:hypothetical protein